MTKMDGFDDCIIGMVERFGMTPVLLYDRRMVITKNMTDGMTKEEAEEWFAFNQLGAWVGDDTPAFAILGPVEWEDE